MNIFALAGLLTAISSGTMALLMFFKGKHSLHYIWGLFCASIMMWGIGPYKIANIGNYESALLWWKIAYIGVIFIPIFFIHFVFKFLSINKKIFIYTVYFLGLLFLAANLFTDLFIKDIKWMFDQFYYIFPPTILYNFFIIFFIGLVFYGHIKLWQSYKKSNGVQRSQIKYLFIATSIGFGGGSVSFLPVYGVEIYPFLNLLIFPFAPIVAYAIFRYRLMDLRIAIRKIVLTVLLSAFVYFVFYLIMWGYSRLFGGVYNNVAYFFGIVVAPLFVIVFIWLKNKIKAFTDKHLFSSLYSSQEMLAKLADELNDSIDLDKIINLIAESIKEAMLPEKVCVLLIDGNYNSAFYDLQKSIEFDQKSIDYIASNYFLNKYLFKTQKLLFKDEIQMLLKYSKKNQEKKDFENILFVMNKAGMSVCAPMVMSDKIVGIIALGPKIGGDAYAADDLDFLNSLSSQAAIAINNAKLYLQVQEFNQTLQQKVEEQTKEIREQKEKIEKAYNLEKKSLENLKKLDQQKSEFMLITQHHLRTPLTSMIGYVSLLQDGIYGRVPAKIAKVIKKFSVSSNSLIRMVNEFLDLSEFSMGQKVVKVKPGVDIASIVEDIINEMDFHAEEKGLDLKFKKPKEEIYKIQADVNKLQAALINIVDNAIKYTQKGSIIIELQNKTVGDAKKVEIIVKDTGIGIEKKQIENLFLNLLNRGENAKKINVTGRGIGLYLSSKIIESHKGKIWAESEGLNKGSAFHIELPV